MMDATTKALVAAAGSDAEVDAPFGACTTYRVGGRADVVVTVPTKARLIELSALLAAVERLIVFANGSNLLVADEGFRGVALRLGEGFTDLSWTPGGASPPEAVAVTAGAALDLPVMARRLAANGVVGFEWAVGVPGTVGGAVAMNAGGHGGDMAGVTTGAAVWDFATARSREWTPQELQFRYRGSAIGPRDLVIGAQLALSTGDRETAERQIREIVQWRRAHQPGGQNAGSVFRNPPEAPAGQLIDEAGCKGLRIGTAAVSTKHANFFQLDPDGRTADVLELIDAVRDRVRAHSGVTLEREVRLIGPEGATW